MKKLVITIIAIFSLVFGAVPAFATQPATLANDFHITYNGIEQDFKDGAEQSVTPIVLEGTTYLPVRAVSNIAGLNVNWNQDTQTVSLTSGGAVTTYNGTPTISVATPISVNPDASIVIALNDQKQKSYSGGQPVYPFIYNGTTYLPVRAVCNMVSMPVDWDATTRTVILGDKASTITPPAVQPVPVGAKVLTDKDMIQLAHEYKDGSFFIESDAGVCPSINLDFNTNGYKTVTFTVTTNDVGDKHNQNVFVVGRDSINSYGKGLALDLTPQAYGTTKTYSVDISGYKVGEINVGAGGNTNAVVSNIYLTK